MNRCSGFLVAALASSFSDAKVSELEFININQVLMQIYQTSFIQIGQVELRELYQNFGGAFLVDSTFKTQREHQFMITLTGQIPQSPSMNQAGYAIVACHEIGHILGGEPRQKTMLSNWSSVEGQADYFATNECLWEFLKIRPEKIKDIEPMCHEYFSKKDELIFCSQAILGIKAIAEYFNSSLAVDDQVSLDNKDLSIVSQTLQKYPSPQCRIDTLLSGLFDQPKPSCWFAQ